MADPLSITDHEERQRETARRRAQCPVAPTGPGTWFLADRPSVEQALREVETFVGSFGTIEGIPEEEQILQWIPEPRHGRLRRIINAVMAPHRTARAEPFVRDLARRLAAEVVAAGRVDVIPAFVDPIPTQVIAHVLGIPTADWDLFRRFSDELLERQGTHQGARAMSEVHPEFAAYVEELVADRRGAGEDVDDMITRFIRTDVDGEHLSDVAIRTQIMVLIIAGNETTRNLLGNVVATLCDRPDLYARLRRDPALVPAVIEESLRRDTPVQILARTCSADVTFAGGAAGPTAIPAGDRVVVGIASANRDESVFDIRAAFDVDRANLREHLAFGTGPHVCPGAALARLESVIAVEELVAAAATLARVPDREVEWNPVFWAHGPRSLWVDTTPAPTRAGSGPG